MNSWRGYSLDGVKLHPTAIAILDHGSRVEPVPGAGRFARGRDLDNEIRIAETDA